MSAPKKTGAIAPTSRCLARSMAAQIDRNSVLPVLELGPGTGAITHAILQHLGSPKRLVCVEYDEKMCRRLRSRFHGLRVMRGDAFDLEPSVPSDRWPQFDCIVSGLPLLNFKHAQRESLLRGALDRLPRGRPFVQFSYGVRAPVDLDDPHVERTVSPWVMKNLPPARVWTYVRTGEGGAQR